MGPSLNKGVQNSSDTFSAFHLNPFIPESFENRFFLGVILILAPDRRGFRIDDS